jgi:site-specific DNA-methyltransferase (cytosine-N4-specific)
MQLDLFAHVTAVYADAPGAVSTSTLYREVASRVGMPPDQLEARVPVGLGGQAHNLTKREIRWIQQTLKHLGLLERVPEERGLWRLTEIGGTRLRQALPDVAMLAFSTDLGIAIWGSWQHVFPRLDVPIVLCLTSPPYALRKPRAYGNPSETDYVDFICRAMEPVVHNLVPGGSIALNVSNDLFLPGSPARSLYLERLVLALADRFGLHLMDRLVWENKSKPPGPMQWASKTRQQLNVSYEHVLWMCNDPARCKADNRRVLLPHSDRQQRLIAQGGEKRQAVYADGAYMLRHGSYGKPTAGRIPRNILSFGHSCPDHMEYRRDAALLGLPAHGAPMPLTLAKFLISFLTEPGGRVRDE